MRKLAILAVLVFLAVILSHLAVADYGLSISKVDAYIDGNHKSASSSGGTTFKVEPESSLKIKVKVANNFPSETDQEIEDITVTGTLEEIDDGDDLEEESDSFDLKEGKTKTVTLEYSIPLQVEADEFNLLIEIQGENSTGYDFNASAEFTVRVDKEKHQLIIKQAQLDRPKLRCDRRTAQLSVVVYNIGEEEEEDVVLSITNPDLDFNQQKSFDLTEDIDDDENRYSASFPISIAESANPGIYPILVKADYSSESVEQTVELTVDECPAPAAAPVAQPTTPATTVVTVEQPAEPAPVTVVPAAVAVPAKAESRQYLWIGAIAVAYIIVIAIIIAVGSALLRRRKE